MSDKTAKQELVLPVVGDLFMHPQGNLYEVVGIDRDGDSQKVEYRVRYARVQVQKTGEMDFTIRRDESPIYSRNAVAFCGAVPLFKKQDVRQVLRMLEAMAQTKKIIEAKESAVTEDKLAACIASARSKLTGILAEACTAVCDANDPDFMALCGGLGSGRNLVGLVAILELVKGLRDSKTAAGVFKVGVISDVPTGLGNLSLLDAWFKFLSSEVGLEVERNLYGRSFTVIVGKGALEVGYIKDLTSLEESTVLCLIEGEVAMVRVKGYMDRFQRPKTIYMGPHCPAVDALTVKGLFGAGIKFSLPLENNDCGRNGLYLLYNPVRGFVFHEETNGCITGAATGAVAFLAPERMHEVKRILSEGKFNNAVDHMLTTCGISKSYFGSKKE